MHDGHDIQTVVEVFPEPLFPDRLFDIPVRGCDDPDIRLDGLVAADALEFVLLQHAQQFHLHRRGKLPDLVEEQGAPVGRLEPADASAVAPVNAPFSCPNSSLSSRFSGRAAQFTLTSG